MSTKEPPDKWVIAVWRAMLVSVTIYLGFVAFGIWQFAQWVQP